jgi:hypothetical protein
MVVMGLPKSKWLLLPYFLVLIAAFSLPADGNHGFFSIKSMTLIGSMALIFFYLMVNQSVTVYQVKLFLFFCGSLAFLIFWFIISLLYDQTTAVSRADQFKLFLTTIIIPVITLFLLSTNLITTAQIFRTIIFSSLFYAVGKLVLVTLHLMGLINVWEILGLLGIQFMQMNIYGGLERLQTSVDIASPFLIFFVLQSDNLGLNLSIKFKRIYIFFSIISTFFGFSRYLLGVYFISCALHWMTLNQKKLLKTIFLIFFALLIGLIIVGPETIYYIIERRFLSIDNAQSDDIRFMQINAMLIQFEKMPFFGTGLGGFASDYVRSPVVKHLYEVQWIAFLMQFGLFGLVVILTPIFFIIFRYINSPFSRVNLSFLGLFLIWILSGFTNPFLISLASGVMYTLFYISCNVLNENAVSPKFFINKNSVVKLRS